MVAEGAGATALAALLYKKYPVQGKNAVAVLSGGNVDVNMLARIIEKGLIKSGRKLKLTTVLRDEPGTLAALLALLSGMHANIVSIVHNRNRIDVPLGGARVELELETRSAEHGDELMRALKEYGYPVMLH